MKETIWLEPCGCGSKNDEPHIRHDTVNDNGLMMFPIREQTDGWDADGAPIPATIPL